MIVLPLTLAHTALNAYVVQALFAVFLVVGGYLGNKYFTFKVAASTPDTIDQP